MGVEIERKYLLAAAPGETWLAASGARRLGIEQVYLRRRPGTPTRRIRTIVEPDGRERYVYNEKTAVDGLLVREEHEREVDRATRDALLREADPDFRPIRKVRHVFEEGGWTWELDVFESPPELVLLEVELPDAAVRPALPAELDVVREVSDETAFLNVNLARIRPDERDEVGR